MSRTTQSHRLMAHRLKPALLACAAVAALAAAPASAQQVDPNRLLEIMVAKGLVTRAEADAMIAQAQASPSQATPVAAAALPPVPAGGVDANGVQTIPYVPQVVRDQIKAELKEELGAQAQAQGWAKPGETPEWTRRLKLYGDVRMRAEGRFYDDGNSDIFTNYGAINRGNPQNINDNTPGWVAPPFLNTLKDRQRYELRARLGLTAQIDDWIAADVRVATGADNSPVTTNQTLGGDGTGKYQLWLDRASIRLTPLAGFNIDFGRFANPFWTGDLIFDGDLNFDGVAISGGRAVSDQVKLYGAAGAFPVFNTDINFGSRNAPVDSASSGPYGSQDRYLLAAQAGVEFKAAEQLTVRLAAGYFFFDNIEGKLSAPCQYYEVACSTDARRPAFQQLGNTVFPIRDIAPDPLNPITSPENQYFGLASKFEILHLRGAVDYRPSDRFGLRLEGEFVKNLGWDRARVAARAVNNLGPDVQVPNPATPNPDDTMAAPGAYDGGDTGWQTRLSVGSVLNLAGQGDWEARRGDWNAFVAYRHLESDAVVDAFADSDFHVGGTNNKGWLIGGNYAIGKNTVVGGRWMSAEEIADAPFSVDRLFIDLSTRF